MGVPGTLELKPWLSVTVNPMWSVIFYNKISRRLTAGNTVTVTLFHPSSANLSQVKNSALGCNLMLQKIFINLEVRL